MRLGSHCATWPYANEISSVDAIKGRRISMNLCLNAFVIQFPNGLLDVCSVTAPRALLLPFAHRSHCKDEDSYKECWSHVEFFIDLTRHKMSDGGRVRALLGVKEWKSSQKWAVRRSAVGSIDWSGLGGLHK